jgi:tetratricopeptide (TPR) repeat protein
MVAFIPLRDIRAGEDLTPAGGAMARYIARDVGVLREVKEIQPAEVRACLRDHESTDRRRLPPSEIRNLSRCLDPDELIWGFYEEYSERYTFRLDYWNKATGAVRHFDVSGPRDEVFATLDRGILDLAEQSGWDVTREEKAALEERETASFPAYMSYHEGRELYEEAEYEKAAKKLAAVLSEEPDWHWARLLQGNCRLHAGDLSGAIEIYENLTEQAPGFLPAWVNLGAACMMQGKAWRARAILKKASRRFGDSAILFYNLGNAYRVLEKDMETMDAYEAAIQLDPEFAEAYHQLAVFYKSRGVVDKARENSRMAQRLRPDLTPDLVENGVPLKSLLMEGRDDYRADLDFGAVGLPEPGKKASGSPQATD